MSSLATRARLFLALASAALAPLAATPAADASLLHGVLPGLLSPATSASTCPAAVQTFATWGDASWYRLASGGSFEGAFPWKLTGGAAVVTGNEPYYVTAPADAHSLSLPAGASATSPATCFGFSDLKLRAFVRGSGHVKVTVVVSDLLGVLSTLDGGTFAAGASWQPTPAVSRLVTNVGGLLTTDSIQLRLTAVDGTVQVDDVYVDPFKSV